MFFRAGHSSTMNLTTLIWTLVIMTVVIPLKPCVAFQPHNTILSQVSLLTHKKDIFAAFLMKRPVQDSSSSEGVEITRMMALAKAPEFDIIGLTSDKEEPRSSFLILALCWGVAFLSALDRVAMSVAMLPLSQEYSYTESIKGEVSSVFSVGYGLAILPCGFLLSVLSPRTLMANGIALWSLATLATPMTAGMTGGGMAPLLAARAAVGAAEAVVLPSMQRFLSSWTSPGQKSMAVAAIYSGFQCGTIGAYTLSPYVMDGTEGWRGLFYTYGAVGLLALVPWLAFAEDSPNGVREGESLTTVDTYSVEEIMITIKSAPWNEMVRSAGVQAITLAHAANNVGMYINLAWAPTFYAEQYSMNVRDSACFAVLPCIAGVVGGLVSGGLADMIIQSLEDRTVEAVTNVRKVFQGIALFGPALCLAVLAWHIPEQPLVAQFLLTGMVGLQAFHAAGFGAGIQDKAGEKW
jgi:MFS transporter, ACS family, solute carrier family 17 (sodium-dependent inorganic phosphate cotransporter), other